MLNDNNNYLEETYNYNEHYDNENYDNENYINSLNKKSNFEIVICDLHNKYLHGLTEDSDSNISGHYIVAFKANCKTSNMNYINVDVASSERNQNNTLNQIINDFDLLYKRKYILLKGYPKYNIYCKHPIIRNYKNMIENENYIKPEIAKCFYLKGGECVAILKTFWIKIIQRVWKKIYKERKIILEKRKSYNYLKFRELRGNWERPYITKAGIYGMLNNL